MSTTGSSHTVSYAEAMDNLKSMFTHLDQQTIAYSLQMNRGHLERTVESLLSLSSTGGSQELNVPASGASILHRRKSSAVSTPSVGGSNLPDDFLRPPSYFAARFNEDHTGATSQIDQDAILAQMLQDEMFMAEIRANPQLYEEEASNAQPATSSAHPQPSASSASHTLHSSTAHHPPTSSSSAVSHTPVTSAARGDFSGAGSSGSNASTSFRDRWNGLTAAAKKRLLTVAGMMKSTGHSSSTSSSAARYAVKDDLSSGLLDESSDASSGGSERDQQLLSSARSSDTVREKDVQQMAAVEVDEGVYSMKDSEDTGDLSEDASSSYQAPSLLNGANRWKKME